MVSRPSKAKAKEMDGTRAMDDGTEASLGGELLEVLQREIKKNKMQVKEELTSTMSSTKARLLMDLVQEMSEKLPMTPSTHKSSGLRTTPSTVKTVIAGQKRRRKTLPKTGNRVFKNKSDFEAYLLVGKYPKDSSPCVDHTKLNPGYPLVYEDWCHHDNKKSPPSASHPNGSTASYYRCRRYRSAFGKRGMARGNVGCECPARFRAQECKDGTVTVLFRGTHNHDVQGEYFNFLNPLPICRTLREMVDEKLYAGLSKAGQIRRNIHDELLSTRHNHKSFAQLRLFNLAIALKNSHILHRRSQLCLDSDSLAHKNDAEAVAEQVSTWERDLGDRSPIRHAHW